MSNGVTTPPFILDQFPTPALDQVFNQPPNPALLGLEQYPDPPYVVTLPYNKINTVYDLKGLLPPTWFPLDDPVVDAILATYADSIATIQGRNDWVYQQIRVATASGIWLDMFAEEFAGVAGSDRGNSVYSGDLTLGGWLYRRRGESDTAYRKRILFEIEICRPVRGGTHSVDGILYNDGTHYAVTKGTRTAMYDSLAFWCGGVAPIIIEPWNPRDTGVQDASSLIIDGPGYLGSTDDPYTSFIITHRAGGAPIQGINDETALDFLTKTPGIIDDERVANTNYLYGGLDAGMLFLIDGNTNESAVTDEELYGVINRTKAEGTKCFVRFTDSTQIALQPSDDFGLLNYNFILNKSRLADESIVFKSRNPPIGYVRNYLNLNFVLNHSELAEHTSDPSTMAPLIEFPPGQLGITFVPGGSSLL